MRALLSLRPPQRKCYAEGPMALLPTYQDLRHRVARTVLGALGWRFKKYSDVDLPKGELDRFPPKFITFGEPHTHFGDFPLMLLFFAYFRLPKVTFPVSSKYFGTTTRHWLTWLGAIPVNTSPNAKNNLVSQLVEEAKTAERLILHIPPSGTRKKTDRWRSGFYHIALQAEIPVIPAYLDGSTKTFGYGEPIYMTGNVKADMDKIRAFYADKRGLVPANESLVRLAAELEEAEGARA
jgi:1-acyl-sn-glycerol-3-phosphate acyltransferase